MDDLTVSSLRARNNTPEADREPDPRYAASWQQAQAGTGMFESQPSHPAPSATSREEQHSALWWWLHDHGGVLAPLTNHERADILRRAYGPQSGLIVRDKDGTPVNVDQLTDDEVIALDKELRGRPIGHDMAATAPLMTPWGWQGSRQYRDAVNELKQAGTHETLQGKVPTREEATRMIEEAGGRVDRQDPGHPPGGVSTHQEPHINYTTADGRKATVIVQGP